MLLKLFMCHVQMLLLWGFLFLPWVYYVAYSTHFGQNRVLFFKKVSSCVINNDYVSLLFQMSVLQYKFLVICDSFFFVTLLDFVNLWQYIFRISKTNWTNLESRLQSFMKNSQMSSLKPLDLKPFRSEIRLLSWMQNGTELIECTVIGKGRCKWN